MKTEKIFHKDAGECKDMNSGLTKLEFCACKVGTKKVINISQLCHSLTNISLVLLIQKWFLLRCAPYWNIANHGFAVGKFCQFSILGVHEASLGMLIGSWASCSSIFLFEN